MSKLTAAASRRNEIDAVESMRYSQFRLASGAFVVAAVASFATSKPFETDLATTLLGIAVLFLLPSFAAPFLPKRVFRRLRANPWIVLTWVIALVVARFCISSPNTLYIPLIVLGFAIAAIGNARLVGGAVAIELLGGALLIVAVQTSGSTDASFDKLMVTYALCPAIATVAVGVVTAEFSRCLDRVGGLLFAVKDPSTASDDRLLDADEERDSIGLLTARLSITPGQARVVESLVEGISNEEISRRLELSARTVQGHIRGAMGRTGLTSRTQLAVAAALVMRER